MKFEQRFADRLGHEPSHRAFLVEFYLSFGGMNIDVHGGRIDFQKESADRIAPFHERGVIAFQQRIIESAILNRPAVDEKVLVLPSGA